MRPTSTGQDEEQKDESQHDEDFDGGDVEFDFAKESDAQEVDEDDCGEEDCDPDAWVDFVTVDPVLDDECTCGELVWDDDPVFEEVRVAYGEP